MIIGLTGGIASGKTVVSDYLQGCGYAIVDADLLARDIMAPGHPALEKVRETFGEEMVHKDGTLNRRALGQRIFHDAAARAALDAITHPLIRQLAEEKLQKLEKAGQCPVFFVAPLLYESGMDSLCDAVWLVHADDALRQVRLAARDDISTAYAAQKIASQMSEEARLEKGADILINDGDLPHLYQQIDGLLKKSKKICKKC